jgi:signal peptidase I
VNGHALHEPYLPAGEPASAEAFDVVVPAGRLWVMGDHRSDSADSRAHLGDPGGGTVPLDRVIGKVLVRFWPLTRLGGNDEMAAATR